MAISGTAIRLLARRSVINPHEDDREAITELLIEIRTGHEQAKDKLFHVLYPKLRQLAQSSLRRERRDHTLQPTALVNEAALKMLGSRLFETAGNRTAFLAAAGRAMHEVLVDHARARAAQKRPTGNGRERVPMDDVVDCFEESHEMSLVELESALQQLRELSRRKYEVVTLHFFGGLKFSEIAEHLNISKSTAEKDWHFARAWLGQTMGA